MYPACWLYLRGGPDEVMGSGLFSFLFRSWAKRNIFFPLGKHFYAE